MARVILEFTVIPIRPDKVGVSDLITEVVKIVKKSNVKFEVTPMSTIMESDNLMALFKIINQAHEYLHEKGIKRVITTILIDDRTDKPRTMESKVKEVIEKIKED